MGASKIQLSPPLCLSLRTNDRVSAVTRRYSWDSVTETTQFSAVHRSWLLLSKVPLLWDVAGCVGKYSSVLPCLASASFLAWIICVAVASLLVGREPLLISWSGVPWWLVVLSFFFFGLPPTMQYSHISHPML